MEPTPELYGDDALEAGLAAGYRPEPKSVLDVIERLTGAEAPRVDLRDLGRELAPPGPAGGKFTPQGRYEIHGEIARGGMGVILQGRDSDLGRDVALKVLREDLAQQSEVVRRFVEEAQIGGQLQHPGIVPVYELGLMADQRPYFAMKLVKGRTLAALLAATKASERRKLLDVFEAVCQTVAYAHSRGVVHRDLKPANVLIGAFGEVQVVDWGLAKILRAGDTFDEQRSRTEPSASAAAFESVRTGSSSLGSQSRIGSVMGTPAYMPPEQARGEVDKLDERSDVFALGAILCEILTGAPPYTGDAAKTVMQAADARLEDATARLDGCDADGELIALCKQCLAVEPSRRPRSAEVLAKSIHDYLTSLEDRAHAAQIHAAEAKIRARATALLSATGIALVLLGGGGWMWVREQRTQRMRTTESAVAIALQEATLARGHEDWPAATAAVGRARARLEAGPASDELRAQVTTLGASIDAEAAQARDAALLAADNAALLAALQDVRQPEGSKIVPADWKDVDRRYEEIFAAHALRIDGEAVRVLRERGISIDLASALDVWAIVRRRAEDEAGAVQLERLADVLDTDPTRRDVRAALAANDLASLTRLAGEQGALEMPAPTQRLLAQALAHGKRFDEAVAVLSAARRRYPQDFQLALELGRILRKPTPTPERSSEAVAHYEAALALRPASVEAWHELGQTLLSDVHRTEQAHELFQNAVRLLPDDGHLHFHLGNVLSTLGRDDEAIASYRRSLELEPDYAIAWCDLGISLDRSGQRDEGVESLRRAVALAPEVAQFHFNLGVGLAGFGRHEDAITSYRRALELEPDVAPVHFNLGYSLEQLGRHDDAIANYQRALELDPKYTMTHFYLGVALEHTGRLAEALDAYRAAVRAKPDDRYARSSLSWLLATIDRADLRDPAGAVEHGRKAAELAPHQAGQWERLGIALYINGEFAEALESLEHARNMSGDQPSRLMFLALAHGQLGHDAEARELFELAQPNLDAITAVLPELRRFVDEARKTFAVDDEH